MTFNDCLKLVNELKSTVGGKEFQALITRFVKKRSEHSYDDRRMLLCSEFSVAVQILSRA